MMQSDDETISSQSAKDVPAGYGSSSEEFSEEYDEGDDTDLVNNSASRNSRTVNIIPAVEPTNSISGGAGVLDNSDCLKIVWTRDSCAKRAGPANVDSSSTGATESKTLTEIRSSSCPDNSDVFSRKPPKTKGSATGSKSDGINWSWVERILAQEANKSTVPHGSVEVDRIWLERITNTWNQKKGHSAAFNKQMVDCWNEVLNPYSSVLHMLENLSTFEGKKHQLLMIILKTFSQYLLDIDNAKASCLDTSIKLRAVALLIREAVPYPHGIELMSKCFVLNHLTDPEMFIVLIRQILERKDYLKASSCIAALRMYNHFSAEEVTLPLLFQGHTGHLEEYLSRCREQQIEFVKCVDHMICRDTNMDVLLSESNVPKLRMDLLTRKSLVKLAVRLMKNYQIADAMCPNVTQERASKSLRYLFYRKYVETLILPGSLCVMANHAVNAHDIGESQWDELVESSVLGNHRLQLELIDLLIDYLDMDGAANWALRCHMPFESLPPQVSSLLLSELWTNEAARLSAKELDSTARKRVASDVYHNLPLSDDSILWVDSKAAFDNCICDIVKDASKVVGFDTEWRPMVAQVHGSRLALIQLAISENVFLLDMLALSAILHNDDWRRFVEEVFCNEEIRVIGYGVKEDVHMLVRSIPVMQNYVSCLNLIDLFELHNEMRHLCPDAFSISNNEASNGCGQVLKTEERGLSDLVQNCLGRPLDKSQQVSDWERRPLRTEQLHYAAIDAYCLLEVYKVLQAKIVEYNVPVSLKSDTARSVKKTKLELRQQRLLAKCQQQSNDNQQQKKIDTKPRNGYNSQAPSRIESTSLTVGHFKVVCDTMLTGLGRQLRILGVDVHLLTDYDGHEAAAEIAEQEGRVLLTAGAPFRMLRKRLPSGQCYNVVSQTLTDQLTEVLQQFNVQVTADDICSRCQICNSNCYLNIHPSEMMKAWQKRRKIYSLPEMSDNCDNVLHSISAVTSAFDHLNLDTLLLQNGSSVRPENIPLTIFKQVHVFYVCANCGKIYWEGSHYDRIHERFAYVL